MCLPIGLRQERSCVSNRESIMIPTKSTAFCMHPCPVAQWSTSPVARSQVQGSNPTKATVTEKLPSKPSPRGANHFDTFWGETF